MKITHVNFSCPTPVLTPDGPVERNSVRICRDYLGKWDVELLEAKRTVVIGCSGEGYRKLTHVPYEAIASFFYSPESEGDDY